MSEHAAETNNSLVERDSVTHHTEFGLVWSEFTTWNVTQRFTRNYVLFAVLEACRNQSL